MFCRFAFRYLLYGILRNGYLSRCDDTSVRTAFLTGFGVFDYHVNTPLPGSPVGLIMVATS